jgi:hypothetical protein
MYQILSDQVRQSLQLMQRCTGYHQREFARLINRLNADPDSVSPSQCLRLCVEAVNSMVAAQRDLAAALMGQPGETRGQIGAGGIVRSVSRLRPAA